MSDIEIYWDAIRKKWPTPQPAFHDLEPIAQSMIIQSVNLLTQVLNIRRQ